MWFRSKRREWLEREVQRLLDVSEDRKHQIMNLLCSEKFLQAELERRDRQVKEVLDRFMALNERAYQVFKAEMRMDVAPPPPTYVDPLGRIATMEATTKEEVEQKENAAREFRELVGH